MYLESIFLKHTQTNKDIVCMAPSVVQMVKISPDEDAILQLECIYDYNYIFIPLNNSQEERNNSGSHWSLVLLDKRNMRGLHYDSISNLNHHIARRLLAKISELLGMEFEFQEMDSAQQNNGYDCGIYLLINAENLIQQITNQNEPEHNFTRHYQKHSYTEKTRNHTLFPTAMEKCLRRK